MSAGGKIVQFIMYKLIGKGTVQVDDLMGLLAEAVGGHLASLRQNQ